MASPRSVVILPVYNETQHVGSVLDEVLRYAQHVVVVDDGSTDGTSEQLDARGDVTLIRHPENQGYGAALASGFRHAAAGRFDIAVTIDCDGQHEPQRIPRFVRACKDVDIVSGSRYLKQYPGAGPPPPQREFINRQVTAELNRRLGLQLTDAFCGFKAYRVSALQQLRCTESGYAMPLELWVQAVAARLKIIEVPVPNIYLDESRSFGGALDDADTRLEYYHQVINRAITRVTPSTKNHLDTLSCCEQGAG